MKIVTTNRTAAAARATAPSADRSALAARPAEIRCYEVLVALRRIMRAIDLHSKSLAQRFGLTGPQLIILRELSEFGEVPVGELARAISLSQATVTGILDRLEKRKLVRRRRDRADKRRVLVRTTPACEATLRDAPPMLQEAFLQSFTRLAEWEQTQILSSLQRVVAMMEATRLDATPMLATGAIDEAAEEVHRSDGGGVRRAPRPKRPRRRTKR